LPVIHFRAEELGLIQHADLMTPFSAYVPCYNNAKTISQALSSLQRQSLPTTDLFLIDDGSSDGSAAIALELGAAVVCFDKNMGRGAVRARAMELARHELVLCCDATNHLPVHFASQAMRWFTDPGVAAVFGRIEQMDNRSLADRWRGRHLFKLAKPVAVRHGAPLSTWGCVLRRSAVLAVGNFDASLRHSEDAELGRRLLAAGFDVVFDPTLQVISGVSNTRLGVLERYWRWHAGEREQVSLSSYVRQVWYSLRVLVPRDIADGDLLAVPLSLLCPHYQFWKSWGRRISGRVQS
jgi:cellulose synthase/poly-beta-1,6-N-acetylglucosamine synthase-like glycosyltransferase